MHSMTGFGCGTFRKGDLGVTVQISSVNRKQLDIRLSLPRDLASCENELRNVVTDKVSRGTIHVTANVELTGSLGTCVRINRPLARMYCEELRAIKEELSLIGDVSITDLVALPELVEIAAPELREDDLREVACAAARQAVKGLLAMRRAEGEAMADDLNTRKVNLVRLLESIRQNAEGVVAYHRDRLFARIGRVVEGLLLDDDGLVREVALFADRCDISEEITRLESHFQQFSTLMSEVDDAVGRRLDFLLQEMFREINTIGSKANDKEISVCVVEFKAELERVREQVQNIE